MFATSFACDSCGGTHPVDQALTYCPTCGGFLETQYDYQALARALDWEAIARRRPTIWKWRELLPIEDYAEIRTLGEGGTPLVASVSLGPSLGLRYLFFKNDGLMPTGSFKDRGFALTLNRARELGLRRGLTYTSGNAGSSFAAYARRVGLDAVILVSSDASDEKLRMTRSFGFPVIRLQYESYGEVDELLSQLSQHLGLYQFVNFINPIRHEGMKTYAYEITEELGGIAPDHMVQPMGTGGGYWGALKGFRELQVLGRIDCLPRMHVVQPAATPPVVEAFQRGDLETTRSGDPHATIAQSMTSDDPIGKGRRVLRGLRETQGQAIAVSDEELLWAMATLGREGIFAEPSAAASVAALRQLVSRGVIRADERVVCVITATGLKQPEAWSLVDDVETPTVAARLDAVKDVLERVWSTPASTRA